MHVGEYRRDRRLEGVHLERFPRIDHVDQMVNHLGLLVRAGLGRSDVHAAVDLHGVHRHQFHIAPVTGHLQRQGRLARCRRPNQGDRPHTGRHHSAPRSIGHLTAPLPETFAAEGEITT